MAPRCARPRTPTPSRMWGLLLALGLTAAPAGAQDAFPLQPLLTAFEKALTSTVERAERSVVAVLQATDDAADAPPGGLEGPDPLADLRRPRADATPLPVGAGVVLPPGNLVLTPYLVVSPTNASYRVRTVDGETRDARLLGADPRSGLAVLAVDGARLPPLALGKAETLRKGALVVAIGNPHGIARDGQPTASFGSVTNLGVKAPDLANLNNVPDPALDGVRGFRTTLHHFGTLIQTDAKLGWNAPGGALVTLDGALVGLTTTLASTAGHEQPAGYAIPINEPIRRVIAELSAGREVEYGLLGISFSKVADAGPGPGGIAVERVVEGGPAASAGMRTGDLVTTINGEPIPDTDKLQLVVSSLPPGSRAEVNFLRDGAVQTASVSLGKIFVAGEKYVTVEKPVWRGVRVDYATALPPEDLRASAERGLIDPQGCVAIAWVDKASGSWKAGVRAGMFVSHVGDTRVATPEAFYAAAAKADASVKLRFTGSLEP